MHPGFTADRRTPSCIRAGISPEKISNNTSGIFLLPSPRERSERRGGSLPPTRSGVGGGGSISVHRCIDGQENARRVFQNLVIPEPQHAIAMGFEISRTHLVGSAARMLTAIDLDNQAMFMTGEVSEVWTYRRLTPKVMLFERRLPQMLPEPLFGFGRVAPQSPRARDAVVNRTLCRLCHPPPTPDPSPPSAFAQEGFGGWREGSRFGLAEMLNSKIAFKRQQAAACGSRHTAACRRCACRCRRTVSCSPAR